MEGRRHGGAEGWRGGGVKGWRSGGAEGWEKRRGDYREAFDAGSGSGNPGAPSGGSCSHTTSIMNESCWLVEEELQAY